MHMRDAITVRCSALGLLIVAGCPPPAADDAGAGDAAIADHAATDLGAVDHGAADAGRVDSGACTVDQRGFCIRVPQLRDVSGSQMLDVDYVCTLDYESIHGFVYVQAHALACEPMVACTSMLDGAWISIGGVASAVAASFDWGGRHNNDFFTIPHDSKVFKYYHSSFGWGWHACQPPDCNQVYQSDGVTLVEDGCTMERTVPQVCVRVEDDGTVPALTDTFAPCAGDPNYADAGAGDGGAEDGGAGD
jgi:hypothetical protein